MIYLDNNATTRVADEVASAMQPFYREIYGNPHSPHSAGRAAHAAVEHAREEVGALLGADASEIVFTSCGTEANALVLRGMHPKPTRRKVVATNVEHPSVLLLLHWLAGRKEIDLQLVPVEKDGSLDLDRVSKLVDDQTLLVSVMLAQNEVGVIYPVEEIAKIAHRSGAMMHVDAVQAAGKIPLDAHEIDCEFLTISGHKLHAPKGIGALYMRKNMRLSPLWLGGGQESGLRSGTEPVPLIVALGRASTLALASMEDQMRVRAIRDNFESRLTAACDRAFVHCADQPRLPNTSSISFEHLTADLLVAAFDELEICVSAGAACHSGRKEPSGVMKALGVPLDRALGTVRFSLSRYTTAEEMEETAAKVLAAVEELYEQHEADIVANAGPTTVGD